MHTSALVISNKKSIDELFDDLYCFSESYEKEFEELDEDELKEYNDEYNENYIDEYDSFESYLEKGLGLIEKNGTYGRYYNPDTLFDWMSIGGRWNETLCDNNYNYVNSVLLKDINWDYIKEKRTNEVIRHWIEARYTSNIIGLSNITLKNYIDDNSEFNVYGIIDKNLEYTEVDCIDLEKNGYANLQEYIMDLLKDEDPEDTLLTICDFHI